MLMAAAERLKDLPELVSIQAYAGTAAPFNFNGLVRHYYMRSNPEQGDLSINLLDKSKRDRASHAIALDIRHRLAGLALAAGLGAQGRRGSAGAAGALDPARRGLWAGPGEPPGARGQGAQGVRVGRLRRRRRRQLRQAVGPPALRHRSGGGRVPWGRAAGDLRHDRRADRRREGRLFAARRGPEADRHQRDAAEERAHARRTHPVDAAAGRRHGRGRAPMSSSATSSRSSASPRPIRSSATTAASPRW